MLAMLKKLSIAVLAVGLVVGVLTPGSAASAESPEAPEAPLVEGGPETDEPPNADLDAKVAAAEPDFNATAGAAKPLTDGFTAGYIISDANFYQRNSMTVGEIQTLLNQKIAGGRCTIGDPGRKPGSASLGSKVASACLKDMKFTSNNRAADAYCKAYSGKTGESAAQIVHKVSAACGISAQALLVVLDKEQSLVSDNWPVVKQYDRAMGYACPDSGPGGAANCDSKYFGFFNQVYSAARQFQIYRAKPNSYNNVPFTTREILFKPVKEAPECGTSPVYLQNQATAGLYNYTPYQPNKAALEGRKDKCSSYGNRNFYVYYKQWFGTPNSFFGDMTTSSKFFTEIEWMGTSGLSTGYKMPTGQRPIYQPALSISREAMAAFLYRLEGASFTPPAVSPFADVNPTDKFYRQITWMHAKGYSTGTRQPSGKPRFESKDPVSRQAMAAFIYRYQGAKYTAPAVSPFADMRQGDKFYREITWMHDARLSTGNKQPSGKPTYLPQGEVSRAAMAAFIFRMEHKG